LTWICDFAIGPRPWTARRLFGHHLQLLFDVYQSLLVNQQPFLVLFFLKKNKKTDFEAWDKVAKECCFTNLELQVHIAPHAAE